MKRLIYIFLAIALAGCRGDDPILPADNDVIDPTSSVQGGIEGFFLLNEGNMGSNKASLDHFSYSEGTYSRNIYGERNPDVAKGLGDVGNDLEIYRGRLWAVVNCSNLVEVMDVATARHLATIAIPNCRYVAFNGNYAYVSSYAGPVQMDQNSRIGYVAKIDVNTFEVVATCEVGYQPEELVVVDTKLYVANSGGYRAPNYDKTVSVIDLATFTETSKIEVGINPHRMELDGYGQLWVSSRGDNGSIASSTYVIDTATDRVIDHLANLPNSRMARWGDRLYVFSTQYDSAGRCTIAFATVDVRSHAVTSRRFIADGTDTSIAMPYALAVHPASGAILVGDARDYVSPGVLHCFDSDGMRRWSVATGDIPAHIVFTTTKLLPLGSQPQPVAGTSPFVTKVFEFVPAPGQFVNQLPRWETGDTQASINAKVLTAIGEGRGGTVSLGGWGGYVVVGFDHTIANVKDKRDFRVLGNAFDGSSEPGVVMVSRDVNANGQPDDPWYELAGSAYDSTPENWLEAARAAGNDVELIRNYQITYFRPDDPAADIRWEDNRGGSGTVPRNKYHSQPYYPQWISAPSITFGGTRLPQNAIDQRAPDAAESLFVLYAFRFGYADNAPNDSEGATFDIDWAVDSSGAPAALSGIDFVKVYTGVNQQNGWIGECSTDFSGVTDLNIENKQVLN